MKAALQKKMLMKDAKTIGAKSRKSGEEEEKLTRKLNSLSLAQLSNSKQQLNLDFYLNETNKENNP